MHQHHFLVEQANECILKYNAFVNRVEDLRLSAAIDAKPILSVSHLSKP